jgi:hypothetical protein
VSCLAVLGGAVFVEDRMALLHPSRLEGCHVEFPALLALDLFGLQEKGLIRVFYEYFFGGLECVGHSFAYVAHL